MPHPNSTIRDPSTTIISTILTTSTNTMTSALSNSTIHAQNTTTQREDRNHNVEFYLGATLCLAFIACIAFGLCYISKRRDTQRIRENITSPPSLDSVIDRQEIRPPLNTYQSDSPPNYNSIEHNPLPPSYRETQLNKKLDEVSRALGNISSINLFSDTQNLN